MHATMRARRVAPFRLGPRRPRVGVSHRHLVRPPQRPELGAATAQRVGVDGGDAERPRERRPAAGSSASSAAGRALAEGRDAAQPL